MSYSFLTKNKQKEYFVLIGTGKYSKISKLMKAFKARLLKIYCFFQKFCSNIYRLIPSLWNTYHEPQPKMLNLQSFAFYTINAYLNQITHFFLSLFQREDCDNGDRRPLHKMPQLPTAGQKALYKHGGRLCNSKCRNKKKLEKYLSKSFYQTRIFLFSLIQMCNKYE